MTFDMSYIMDLIEARLQDFIPFAESFGKTRFLVYRDSIYGTNEKELQTIDRISDSFRCEIIRNSQSFSLMFYMDEDDPGGYLTIMDQGMPTAMLGGDGGIARNPDGSTYRSKVPAKFWGQPAVNPEDTAKPASGLIHEIKTMLADLFRSHLSEAIASVKTDIANMMKQQIVQEIQSAM